MMNAYDHGTATLDGLPPTVGWPSHPELQAIAAQSEVRVMRFNVKTRIAEHFYDAPGLYNMPIVQENVPLSTVMRGAVSSDTVENYVGLFNDAISGKPFGSADARIRMSDGKYRWHHANYVLIHDNTGQPTHAIVTYRENDGEEKTAFDYEKWCADLSYVIGKGLSCIDRRHEELRRLSDVASHDPLTHVLNRTALEHEAEQRAQPVHSNALTALFLIDLDDFKLINDTHGHCKGDAVLRHSAEALNRTFEEEGVVGRLGGDEFAACVSALHTNQDVEQLAARLIAELKRCSSNDECPEISASVGIATTHGGRSFDELYLAADEALYAAKREGKHRYRIVSTDRAFTPRASDLSHN